VVVGFAAFAGLWQVSASPQFCNSCHIMRPYVDAWKHSSHSAVACVQCHYPPGFRDTLWVKFQAMSQVAKWATQTYSSKPFAEVEDASCLRSGCHSQIVVEKHFEVATSTCFLCHFKGTKSGRELTPIAGCTGCHQPPRGDIVVGSIRFNHEEVVRRGVACEKCHLSVVAGEGEAPRERCFTCHNQLEKIERYADTPFVHRVHAATHAIECTRCHTEIKHRSPPPIGPPTADGSDRPGAPRLARR